MKTFQEWLKEKRLKEIVVGPLQQRQIIGNAVGAQQPNSPSNVATSIVKNLDDKQTLGALAIDPTLRAMGDKQQQIQNDPNKAKNVNTNLIGNMQNAAKTAGGS